jgi:steroid delta-isomerase-like uncharacterized protein
MAIDNKQITRRLIEDVWSKGRVELIDELVDPNFEAKDPLLGTLDRDGLREAVKGYRSAFPDLKFEVVSLLAEGNHVSMRWIARGTNLGPFMGAPSTGRAAVVTGINYTELRNGKVISDTFEFDGLGLMRQLGLNPVSTPIPARRQTVETGKRT